MGIGTLNTLRLSRSRLTIGLIGTYVPRRCGIATFTKDVFDSISKVNPLNHVEVAALNDNNSVYSYPKEVKFQIKQNDLDSYFEAAEFFNNSEVSVINLQHEFGIFGGLDGEYILNLLKKLKKPVITTLHTVRSEPTEHCKQVLQEIVKYSHSVNVLISDAAKILINVYKIPANKVFVIPHGVPEVHFFDSARIKKLLNLEGKKVISTFGLLSRIKGIEYAIEAIAGSVKDHPDILFLILGQTHPTVLKKEGEAYRQELEAKVKALGLEKNVSFVNKYLTLDELLRYLLASDIYLVPYLNPAQAASGTLAYAIGCGKAAISTPFIYAKELLSNNRGLLVPFKDPDAMTLAINRVLSDPKLKHTLAENAYKHGRQMIWSNIGKDYIRLYKKANFWARWRNRIRFMERKAVHQIKKTVQEVPKTSAQAVLKKVKRTQLLLAGYPQLTFDHLYRLTDSTGVLQFSIYSVPNKKAGYSLDNNARALIAMVKKYRFHKNADILDNIRIYLSFINYAYKENGTFHNFLNFDRSWADEIGSEDSFGRALWALSFTYYSQIDPAICSMAQKLVEEVISKYKVPEALRAKAFTIIGLSFYYYLNPQKENIKKIIKEVADQMVQKFESIARPNWQWFENYLTYSNGRLPQALLMAYAVTHNKKYLEIAEKSLKFLADLLFINDELVVVGNKEWYEKDGVRSFYAQQPIDASCLVDAYILAHQITKNKEYYNYAKKCIDWFFGKNSTKESLYDPHTGGCFNGLPLKGAQGKQGSEATIAYILAYLAFLELNEKIFIPILELQKEKSVIVAV